MRDTYKIPASLRVPGVTVEYADGEATWTTSNGDKVAKPYPISLNGELLTEDEAIQVANHLMALATNVKRVRAGRA